MLKPLVLRGGFACSERFFQSTMVCVPSSRERAEKNKRCPHSMTRSGKLVTEDHMGLSTERAAAAPIYSARLVGRYTGSNKPARLSRALSECERSHGSAGS